MVYDKDLALIEMRLTAKKQHIHIIWLLKQFKLRCTMEFIYSGNFQKGPSQEPFCEVW
jgi:hypothetical protein